MNYLNNEKIVDLICVFPVAQQVVGLGSIIINMMKIAKEAFLFLENTYAYSRATTLPYPITSPGDWSDFSPAINKKNELQASYNNASSDDERVLLLQEITDLQARLEKCLAYAQEWRSQNARVANYFDNMKIGFYRSIPGFGTVYSLRQCYNNWQPAQT